MNKQFAEGQFGHGARSIHPLRRAVVRSLRPSIGKGAESFDWNKGYDVRDTIGQIEIKNQGESFSCSGQAGSYFLEIQRRLQNKTEGRLSAKSIYSLIDYVGGGATVGSLTTQVASAGANLEVSVPSYYSDGSPFFEEDYTNTSWETDDLNKDALTRAGYTPFDIGEGIEEVACAIRDYGAIIWEIQGKNNGTWLSSIPRPPSSSKSFWSKLFNSNQNTWNHFMCVIGAKMLNGKKTVIALNSWGNDVGDNGVQYFQEEYFNSGFILDCFTFIYDTHITPVDTNSSIWASIALWFKSQPWFSTA